MTVGHNTIDHGWNNMYLLLYCKFIQKIIVSTVININSNTSYNKKIWVDSSSLILPLWMDLCYDYNI